MRGKNTQPRQHPRRGRGRRRRGRPKGPGGYPRPALVEGGPHCKGQLIVNVHAPRMHSRAGSARRDGAWRRSALARSAPASAVPSGPCKGAHLHAPCLGLKRGPLVDATAFWSAEMNSGGHIVFNRALRGAGSPILKQIDRSAGNSRHLSVRDTLSLLL